MNFLWPERLSGRVSDRSVVSTLTRSQRTTNVPAASHNALRLRGVAAAVCDGRDQSGRRHGVECSDGGGGAL